MANTQDNLQFHNPVDIGSFDLTLSQVDKSLPFKSIAGVIIPEAKVDVFYNNQVLKSYTVGSGLEITGTNTPGFEKTVTLTLTGIDFASRVDRVLLAKCSFLSVGDVDFVFYLKILK